MRISDWSSDVCSSDLHYDEDCHCAVTPKHLLALQVAQRAIRLVRSRASELKINPRKIGVIGFSAGGYLVAQTSNIFEPAYEPVDEIDKVSSRPDFAIAMFPRSEEHTSELQSLMRISYAVFCLQKKK